MENKERIESSYNSETYTDEEVRSIAYKYMDYRTRIRLSLCIGLPVLLFFAAVLVLAGISTTFTIFYIMSGVFVATSVFLLCVDIHAYKIYKKEEQRLRNEYGDEFLERATWFKKRRKD